MTALADGRWDLYPSAAPGLGTSARPRLLRMSFNSTTFVFSFVAVFSPDWTISRARWARFALLFLASCVFYMSWNAKFVVLILFSTVVDYYLGAALHRTQASGRRRLLLIASLVANLGLLGYFKYANFFAENFHEALRAVGLGATGEFVRWDIVLPVGISFYTFQTLSYTIDIYRREIEPTDSLLKFALFVAFFPQLVAGPIVRAKEFLPQLDRPAQYDDGRTQRGLFLMLVGMVKKVALADVVGKYVVDPVYADPGSYHPIEIACGVYGALFQFYLDFSAYSDIAIGCAACLGYSLTINFDRPFLSQDLSEFWRRWHISMTSWFRDYVFISLGGTRSSRLGLARNLMATMLLTGLWHGAGWNYVIWGGMYGVAMFATSFLPRTTAEQRESRGLFQRFWRRTRTFHFVALSMLFFRNGTLAENNRGLQGSVDMLGSLFDFEHAFGGLSALGLAALAIAAAIHFSPKAWIHENLRNRWVAAPSVVQAAVLVLVTGLLGAMAASPFIYFQF